MLVPWVDPETQDSLVAEDGQLVNRRTREVVASIRDGIPRFVTPDENYAESFGWQWKKWEHLRSISRGSRYDQQSLLMQRTHFDDYDMAGKTLLECGMGGGDDTEVLLELPFSEVHAFDISTSVERAAKYLANPRLMISQASIFDIPYPDASFDFVFCHRMLQHTPDPERALRSCCAKVKKGGVLFAHSYKKSFHYMMGAKYKVRWLTKRLPWQWVYWYVDTCGQFLHNINAFMYRWLPTRAVAFSLIPFFWISAEPETAGMPPEEILELEKCITFDALTPMHDHPLSSRKFREILESEGFRIDHIYDPTSSPIFGTAVRL